MADFLEIRFPVGITYGPIGGPTFLTTVLVVGSGDEQRNARWTIGRAEFTVDTILMKPVPMNDLISFFRIVQGRKFGFRLKDNTDFKSVLFTSATTPLDQVLGTGDDTTKIFQLIKTYTNQSQSAVRTINKPVAGTVKVAVATVTQVEGVDFSVDTTTGLITLLVTKTVTGTDISAFEDSNTFSFISTSTDFSQFSVNDRIEVAGFVSSTNNRSGLTFFTITALDLDSNGIGEITVDGPTVNEVAGPSITINVHPAPDSGDLVTAGYEFDVPVRFDTDKLSLSISNFELHDWRQVNMIELRV